VLIGVLKLSPMDPVLYRNVHKYGAGGVFATGGDSGARVLDARTSRPIGRIIGYKGNRSFVSPIKVVLQRFGV
jgi:hypothetical protein